MLSSFSWWRTWSWLSIFSSFFLWWSGSESVIVLLKSCPLSFYETCFGEGWVLLFLLATAEAKQRWGQLMAVDGDWEVLAWKAAKQRSCGNSGVGSEPGRNRILHQYSYGNKHHEEDTSVPRAVWFPHLFLHLHLLSRSLPQAEGRGEHSHIKQSVAEPVLLWHSSGEALQSPRLHTALAQTPLEGLLRERGTAELLTYFSGCFSSAFQLLLELQWFTALQLIMRCLVAFRVC